jgi:predicted phosphodiesterase
MNVHLASDLHLEFLHRRFPDALRVSRLYTPWADVLVLAGDIHNGVRAVELFGKWPHPVLYVPGNHEFYEHTIDQTLTTMKKTEVNPAVIVIYRTEWLNQGVRI